MRHVCSRSNPYRCRARLAGLSETGARLAGLRRSLRRRTRCRRRLAARGDRCGTLFDRCAALKRAGLATRRRAPRLDRRLALVTAVLGLSGVFLYNSRFFTAWAVMAPGRAALSVAQNPALTALLLAICWRERLGLRKGCRNALAFVGAILIIARGTPGAAVRDITGTFGAGERFMLAAVFSWAVYAIVSRFALHRISPWPPPSIRRGGDWASRAFPSWRAATSRL